MLNRIFFIFILPFIFTGYCHTSSHDLSIHDDVIIHDKKGKRVNTSYASHEDEHKEDLLKDNTGYEADSDDPVSSVQLVPTSTPVKNIETLKEMCCQTKTNISPRTPDVPCLRHIVLKAAITKIMPETE